MDGDGDGVAAADARITIVEFADPVQPFTTLWQPTLEQLLETGACGPVRRSNLPEKY